MQCDAANNARYKQLEVRTVVWVNLTDQLQSDT